MLTKDNIQKRCHLFCCRVKEGAGLTGLFCGIYFLALFSLLRAGFHYKDDLGRAFEGYRHWEYASRYLSNWLSVILHTDTNLSDISPLPQLLAVVVMAAASSMLLRVFQEKEPKGLRLFLSVAAVSPLALCPYFLECFSFTFDSPYMALSVLFSILPFLFAESGHKTYALISVPCLFGMCMTYQSMSGVYPMLVMFLGCDRWLRKRWSDQKAFFFSLVSAVCYLFSLGVYRFFLVFKTPGYTDTEIPPLRRILPTILHNYLSFGGCLLRDMRGVWTILLALLVIFWWMSLILRSKRPVLVSAILGGVTLLLTGAAACGVYLLFSGDLLAPRMMSGISVWIAVIGMMTVLSENGKFSGGVNLCAGCAVTALAWCFFSFSFTYGNALRAQQRYTEEMAAVLVSDLNELNIMRSEKVKTVRLEGDIGFAPEIRHLTEDCMMLYRLVPVTLGDYLWGEYYFRNYLGIPNIRAGKDSEKAEDYPVMKDTMLYTLSGDEENLVIMFKTKSREEQMPGDTWLINLLLPLKEKIDGL